MDIKTMDQGLLKRNPSMTPEQFSTHWLTKHAPLIVPFFLDLGVQHYEQMHGPLTTTSTTFTSLISTFDGAAGMPSPSDLANFPPPSLAKWKLAYYREVILVDERRFLASEALEHIHRVPPMTVDGERKIVIRDGKCLIDVPESVWEVWREYEARGTAKGE
ncbi:hypothetical protein N431DRAFT_482390 [Stipitochalara longipes BDJ]|nr:hypothetical protein N431DRAFT_482390 [Stipitochalara longipes BDJ]